AMKTEAVKSRIRRGPYKTFRNTQKTPLNIIDIFRAVGIQEASSSPRPSTPRRSASPTLSRREFIVAAVAPRKTPKIPMYGLVLSCPGIAGVGKAGFAVSATIGVGLVRASIGVNGGRYRHTGTQLSSDAVVWIKNNLHGNALGDFCEVAGRIIRR